MATRTFFKKTKLATGFKFGALSIAGAGVLVGIWIGLGFIGYGLALGKVPGWAAANQHPGEVRAGQIAEIRGGPFDRGYRFKIRGIDLEFFVPNEFLPPEGMPSGYQVGAGVGVKSTYKGVVLEMSLNAGTPFQKIPVQFGDGPGKYQRWVDATTARQKYFLMAGLAFFILPIVAFGIVRMKFAPARLSTL